MRMPPTRGLREVVVDAIAVCCRRANLRRTIKIALVVGTVLTAINEGDVLIHGQASATTAVKIAFNFMIPFIVSNLGVLAGDRSARS
jgi:hypothetical protein